MHKHETGKTRITLERVTVTTIRRASAQQPVYCEICRRVIEADELPLKTLLQSGETPAVQLLGPVADEPDKSTKIEPDIDTNGEQTK